MLYVSKGPTSTPQAIDPMEASPSAQIQRPGIRIISGGSDHRWRPPRDDTILITAKIGNVKVKRLLADTGNSRDMFFLMAFQHMVYGEFFQFRYV